MHNWEIKSAREILEERGGTQKSTWSGEGGTREGGEGYGEYDLGTWVGSARGKEGGFKFKVYLNSSKKGGPRGSHRFEILKRHVLRKGAAQKRKGLGVGTNNPLREEIGKFY